MDVPAIVNESIAAVAAKAGITRPRVHIEPGSNLGDGYTSVIYRVVLNDEEKSDADALRLICKTTASKTGNTMQFLFEGEGIIYSTLVPILEDVAKLQEPLPWPRCIHVNVTKERPCLLMADKSPERFRMCNRRVPLDEHHLRHALFQVGRFHGATIAMQALRPEQFTAVSEQLTDSWRSEDVKNFWKSFFLLSEETPEKMLERFPEGTEKHRKIKHFFSTFGKKYFDEMWLPGKGVGNSIVHGDCHFNNMMFQYDEAGAVTGCVLIDFQTAHFAVTTQDLTTLVLSGTEKSLRAKHLDGLLKHYFSTLQQTMRDAGIEDPDAVYSWDQFMTRLRETAGYGLFLAPLLIQGMEADEASAKELQESFGAMISEEGDATEALTFTTGTPFMTIKWSPEILRRTGDLIEDFLAWGWL